MEKKTKIVESGGLKTVDAEGVKRRHKTITKAKKTIPGKSKVKQYIHEKEKRVYNPPVGLVTPESDQDLPAKKYSFDPHLDPQLEWSGKVENSDFEVNTVSLHRHERIDPMTIISKVLKKQNGEQQTLFPFFEKPENVLPLRNAIEFYKHEQNWSNRLIAGDSLLVMNSLLEKEGMEGKAQMIYIDPPYGIKYGSNFQPFVNNTVVTDGKTDDLTQEPEMVKAFRDTWELGIHSYLSYLRHRLILSKKLLSTTGSCFVQISDENVHMVRILMDEIFGRDNFVAEIIFSKTSGFTTKNLSSINDFVLWYAKNKKEMKYHQLFIPKNIGGMGIEQYRNIELPDGTRRTLTKLELENPNSIPKGKLYSLSDVMSQGETQSSKLPFIFKGKEYFPSRGRHWSISVDGLNNLVKKDRVVLAGNTLGFIRYLDDFPVKELTNIWNDTTFGGFVGKKIYVVQTATKVVMRCLLMTTDPGDLILDPTCGSGTAALVAEKYGRRWITCDTSRVAISLTKQRLMTSLFDYFELSHPNEGIKSGFKYEKVPHKTLKSIAYNEPEKEEILFDRPVIDKSINRVSGPFTVEAVPSPTVKSIDIQYEQASEIDSSISRTAENKRQQDWRGELLYTGVRGKGGQKIEFSRIEPRPASQWIHAVGETKEKKPKTVAVSFGPEYSPLDPRQIELAIHEAQKLVPKPELIIFVSLQFDPEAAKDIDELQYPGVQVLKVQANADLLTSDLKKKRTSSESFWLMGQPDVELKKQNDGKYVVEVKGFDYYNSRSGEMESGDSSRIAMWLLDTDYNERNLYPQQVFFPMSGTSDGWSKLAKTLKSEIDEELIEHYSGTKSLPFSAGSYNQVAVKIIDDRGIESLRIIRIE